jgi:hypothetical protein
MRLSPVSKKTSAHHWRLRAPWRPNFRSAMPTRWIGLSGEKYLPPCCTWFLRPRPTRFPKSKVSRFFAFHFQAVETCIFYKLPNIGDPYSIAMQEVRFDNERCL